MKFKIFAVASLVLAGVAGQAQAAIVLGGISFDDNAFADSLISSSGAYTIGGGAVSLEDAIVGSDASDYAFSNSVGAYVEVGFNDNFLVNGSGADLALFELGIPDAFAISITIGGTTLVYGSVDTGETAGGFNLNVAMIDLDDFGIAPGAFLNSIVIGMDTQSNQSTRPSLTAVGAINSASSDVPEPASIAMWGLGALGLICARRKRRQIKLADC